MARVVLKFEKYLDPDSVFESIHRGAAKVSGTVTRVGNRAKYEYMGHPVKIEVGVNTVSFSFLESGIDPLARPIDAFVENITKEWGRPGLELGIPAERKAMWLNRLSKLF